MNTLDKLNELRSLMQAEKISAYYIPQIFTILSMWVIILRAGLGCLASAVLRELWL